MGLGSGQLRQEGLRLRGEPATHFHTQHHQTRPGVSANQLWVSGLLAPPRSGDLGSIFNSSPCGGSSITPQSTDEGGVHSQLSTTEQRKAIHNDLEPPSISNCSWEGQIQITHQHVGCDTTASLTADASCDALESPSPLAQNPSPCARCSVVAQRVEWEATPAGTLGEGKGQLETAEKCHTEELSFQPRNPTSRRT